MVLRTTVIGFGASAVLPARAGEVIRPYLLARQEGLSATAAFATIIVERILDLVAVLVLLAAFLIAFDPGLEARDSAVFSAIRFGGSGHGAGRDRRLDRDVFHGGPSRARCIDGC